MALGYPEIIEKFATSREAFTRERSIERPGSYLERIETQDTELQTSSLAILCFEWNLNQF